MNAIAIAPSPMALIRKTAIALWVGLGYLLSPLSWWNDLFFNLPIAYGFGYAIALVAPDWFLAATVVGYWLSNVLGIVMMQTGVTGWVAGDRPRNWRRELLWSLGGATIYSLAIALLVYWHLLPLPDLTAAAAP